MVSVMLLQAPWIRVLVIVGALFLVLGYRYMFGEKSKKEKEGGTGRTFLSSAKQRMQYKSGAKKSPTGQEAKNHLSPLEMRKLLDRYDERIDSERVCYHTTERMSCNNG